MVGRQAFKSGNRRKDRTRSRVDEYVKNVGKEVVDCRTLSTPWVSKPAALMRAFFVVLSTRNNMGNRVWECDRRLT